MDGTRTVRRRRLWRPPGPAPEARRLVAALVLVCAAIEAALLLGDLGWLGPPRLRGMVYEYGAFWPGLLRDWQANYPGQPAAMFFTYAFLHGGPLHLVVNMITLWSLSELVTARLGAWRFAVLYFVTAVAGAAVFAFLSTANTPMVGASGALFGLAGALLSWMWDDQPTLAEALRFAGRAVLLLLAINVALHFLLAGQLAWQTHLGGFLAGWILALVLDPGGGR